MTDGPGSVGATAQVSDHGGGTATAGKYLTGASTLGRCKCWTGYNLTRWLSASSPSRPTAIPRKHGIMMQGEEVQSFALPAPASADF